MTTQDELMMLWYALGTVAITVICLVNFNAARKEDDRSKMKECIAGMFVAFTPVALVFTMLVIVLSFCWLLMEGIPSLIVSLFKTSENDPY